MKSLKKVLICLLTATYLLTSVGDLTVFAEGNSASPETETVSAPEAENEEIVQADITPEADDEPGTPTRGYTVTEIEHGQRAQDENNEMEVTMIDQNVVWLDNDGHKDAVRKATNSAINEDATALTVQYKIYINLDEYEYVNYQKDGVCITIPRTIFKSINNYTATSPTMSLDSGIGVYKIDNLFNAISGFTYQVSGDYLKITNTGVLASRTIEITLSYKPAKASYYYADYNPGDLVSCASLPFKVNLSLTSSSGKNAVLEAEAPCVYIDTNAQVYNVTKEINNSWKDTVTVDGVEVQYLYVQFKIKAEYKSDAYKNPTQAYTYNYSDVFSGWADITYGDESNNDFSWEFVGWYPANSLNPSDYKTNQYFKTDTPTTSSTSTRYCLFRVQQPESMYVDYKLENTAEVKCEGIWGVDGVTSDDASATYSEYWHNTNPHGRYFVHNWSNLNWESSAHKRTVGGTTLRKYFEHPWKNANRELDRFANQQNDIYGDPITELRGLRYWSWYEGYPSLAQETANKVKFVCENKDIQWAKNSNSTPLTPTSPLSADNYFLKELGFYVEAKYATHNGTYWVVDKNVDPFENDCEPIYVYCLVDGKANSNWQLICTVNYNKTTKKWDDITINSAQSANVKSASYTQYEGEGQKNYGSETGIFIEFANQNVYGYRIENVNKHYYFFVSARANYSLKSNQTTRYYCGADEEGNTSHRKEYWLYVYDFADMDIYDWNYPEQNGDSTKSVQVRGDDSKAETSKPGDRVFRFSDTNSKVDRVAGAVAAGENNALRSEKKLIETEQIGDSNLYRARWKLQGWSFFYSSVSPSGEYYPVRRAPMLAGVFYDVLPRGAVLEDMDDLDKLKEHIKVYKNPLWTGDYQEPAPTRWDNTYLIKDAPKAAQIDEMFLIGPEGYSIELYDGEKFNNKDLDGLVVLVVRITQKSEPYVGTLPGDYTDQNLAGGYTVVFDTYTPYSVLAENGTRIVNAMCFEALNNTSYKEAAYLDDPDKGVRKADGKDPNPLLPLQNSNFADYDKVKSLLTGVDTVNADAYWFTYDYDECTAFYDTIAQSGPSKLVAGDDGELVMDLEVEPGGTYTYYLRYATSTESSAKNLVFYDKIETYSDSEVGPSQWHGKLVALSAVNNSKETIPATYYISTQDDADQHELTDTSVWTQVDDSTDLSVAVWVAADLGDYEVKPLDIAFVKLTMEAPTSNESNYVKPETYNSYRVKGMLKDGPGGQYAPINNVTNYTTVKYTLKGKIQIQKVDEAGDPISGVQFTLTGTSKFNTSVNRTVTTDAEGKAVIDNLDISGDDGYTLTEKVPTGYVNDGTTWNVVIDTDGSSEIDGEDATTVYYLIVNKKSTEIRALKGWLNDDGTATPPASATVTFTLYANGSPTLYSVILDGTADPEITTTGGYELKPWIAYFVNLPKYDETGAEIKYTVVETEGYIGYTPSTTGGVEDNGEIINIENTKVSVIKKWDDNDDQDGIRPDSVTFTLYADGTKVSSITLDGTADENGEAEAWKATWENHPKKNNGTDIEYTVKEEELGVDYEVIYEDGKTYAVDGGTITNKHITEETSVSVKKIWDDEDDQDGIRPDSVTFTLYADGTKVSSITLDGTADENGEKEAWLAKWEKLPKKDNGTDIEYTVKEEELGVDYEVIYEDGKTFAVDGGTIINRHVVEYVEFDIRKIWQDNDDAEFKRPASITVNVLADGAQIMTVVIKSDENGDWAFHVEGLPRYKDGVEIKYTITEETVQEYVSEITGDVVKGFDIYNTYGPNTGDTSKLLLWSSMTALSLLGSVLAVAVYLKKEEEL